MTPHPEPAAVAAAAAPPTSTPLRLLALGAALGVPVAAATVLYESLLHAVTDGLWTELPDAAGWNAPPWWYVLLVPAAGGAVVYLARRLPGHGGHSPLEGVSLAPAPTIHLVSVLLAALATLGAGLVLGPEAPLLALGMALGLVGARLARAGGTDMQVLGLAGAFTAIATLFGGPLPAAFLLFEAVAAAGTIDSRALGRVLLPGFAAAGTGALLITGVGDWPGVHTTELAVSLPPYDSVRILDALWCLPLAVVVAILVLVIQHLARRIASDLRVPALALLVGGGLAVGALAVAFRLAVDRPVDLVLFSGQPALNALASEQSASVLALVVVAKGLAYAISMGAGFRGGPVFPAVAIGVAGGVCAAVLLPGVDVTPAVIAGVSASAAAALRMPFFAALMAALLAGDAALDTAPIAVLAAVVGWVIAETGPGLYARVTGSPVAI